MRQALGDTILVSGGSSMFDGFNDRLKKEIESLAPAEFKTRLISDSLEKKQHLTTWRGASCLASLSSFD